MKEAYDKWLEVYNKVTNAKNDLEIINKSKRIEKIEKAIQKLENELKDK